MSARVCFVVGARPNFMKSAPVHRELAALDPSLELVLLHTGQHYDDAMSDVFFRELGMPRPDEFLGVGQAVEGGGRGAGHEALPRAVGQGFGERLG